MEYQEWLKSRSQGIGGSEASCIVGMNPYKSNVELWEEKTGRRQPEDIGHKPYVQYGIKAEEPLRELFILDHPQYTVEYEEYKRLIHPAYPFLLATLDGKLTEIETGRRGVLEVKTTNILQSMQKEKWNDKIPDNYYIQCLHYLLVTGYDFLILKAQLKTEYGGQVRAIIRHYQIERDDVKADIDYLLEKEVFFWTEFVQKDRRPNLILPPI